MPHTDLALIEQWIQRRDPEAFAAIAQRYAGVMFGAARRVLGNESEAEDIAQETLLELARCRMPPKRNVAAWLHQVALNKARDHKKSESRRREREKRYIEGQSDANESWQQIEPLIDEVIARLPERLREPLVRHYLAGETHQSLAQELGVSRQTVTYRIGQGVEQVRGDLRRRGIAIGGAALAAALTERMAEAAPAPLIASLGKVAVSGALSTTAAMGTSMSVFGAGTLAKLTLTITAIGAIGAASFLLHENLPDTAPPPPLVSAAETSDAIATSATSQSTPDNVPPSDATNAASPAVLATMPSDNWRVLTGTVTDAAGNPYVRPAASGNSGVEPKVRIQSLATKKIGHSYAGTEVVREDSRFIIDSHPLGSSGVVWAICSAKNAVSERLPFSLTPEGSHEVELPLKPAARISGTLLDADGLPVPKSQVSFYSNDHAGVSDSTHVDEHGRFDIGLLPPGDYRITALGVNESVSVRPGQHASNVNLVFDKHRSAIAGYVVDADGIPVADRHVWARALEAGIGFSDMCEAVTDANGSFTVPVYVPPNTFELTVPNLRMAGDTQNIRAEAGASDVVLVVEVQYPVRGRVLLAETGEPATSFSVTLRSGSRTTSSGPLNDKGEFELISSGPDAFVTAAVPGVGSEEQHVTLTRNGTDLLFRIGREKGVTGRVVTPNGDPIEGAAILKGHSRRIDLATGPVDGNVLATSAADGTFQILGLPLEHTRVMNDDGTSSVQEIRQHVVVMHDDYAPAQVDVVRDSEWTIELNQGGAIEGTVTAGGKPAHGQPLLLRILPPGMTSHEHVWTYTGETDVDGHVLFTEVPAGNGTLEFNGVKRDVSIVEGELARAVFNSPAQDAALSGHVLVGNAPASAQVTAYIPAEGGRMRLLSDTTDGKGAFEIDNLISGTTEIETMLVGETPRRKRSTAELVEGATTQLNVQFAEASASLEGPIELPMDGDVTATLDLLTETGSETVLFRNLPIADGAYALGNLPSGTGTFRVSFSNRRGGGMLSREYEVELKPGFITQQEVSLVGLMVGLTVSGAAPDEPLWILVFPGEIALPDFQAMTINEIEAFQRENPPSFVGQLESEIGPLFAGLNTVVVIAPGTQIQNEDHVIPGLRYAWKVVDVSESAPTKVEISLR